ncbi:MAG: hypothetical protein WCK02_14345 [Bacteroidota bacterium]
MKKIFFIAVILFASVFANAQVPTKMSYQAVIRNPAGVLVKNTQVAVRLNILQGSATGTLVYTEDQTPTTNNDGLISIAIGGGVVYDTITWANGPYFLETLVDVDLSNGIAYNFSVCSQLLTVPYALYAKSSGSDVWKNNTTYISPLKNSSLKVFNDSLDYVIYAPLKNQNIGTDWHPSTSKSGVVGLSNAKSFQSGVFGYIQGSSVEDEGGVVGSYDANHWAALAYYKNAQIWAGYFKGNTYTNGNIISTNDVNAQKYVFTAPKVHYMSISAAAFTPTTSSVQYTNGGGMGGAYLLNNTSGAMHAPVTLPHGAVVTGIRLIYFDNSIRDVQVSLYQKSHGSFSSNIATVTSNGTLGDGIISSGSLNTTIDNINNIYYLWAFNTWDTDQLKIMGVTITYTTTEAE